MNTDAFSFDTLFQGLTCGVADWNEIWGDPWISGTTLMVAYGVSAFLIYWVGRGCTGRERGLWMLCAFLFAVQVLNTPLDLHAMIFTIGRCLAHAQGWYDARRDIQAVFLIGAALAIVLFIICACFFFRASLSRNVLLITGVSVAIGFTLLKGTSYHFLEALYARRIGAFYSADLIELFGICIAFGAALWRKTRQNLAQTRQAGGT